MIQPQVAALLSKFPQVRHIMVEDGKGRPLGRSFPPPLRPFFADAACRLSSSRRCCRLTFNSGYFLCRCFRSRGS